VPKINAPLLLLVVELSATPLIAASGYGWDKSPFNQEPNEI
jgi:hypothetical protein